MFRIGSNIEGIDQGRAALATGELASIAADRKRQVEAVKALRGQVRYLSLVDALHLVQEVQTN